ncbi:hypothetical protein NHF50_09695 [Flavobacterium sp. NRK F10]|uniref:hypothetical protein n=1 Tax=Flavobacterium TaxID=237 RepID=UPI0011B27F28|nr:MULTISPECIES: hypothetical protein [Flavobacterium]MCO6175314.1 hypothetical protein [Flavobacterium sp. NRK F10]
MKKYFLALAACSLFSCFNTTLKAQTVTLSDANVVTCNSVNAVYVSGTLSGRKGVPITAYSVYLIYGPKNETVQIDTVQSTGGQFSYIGLVPDGTTITAPYQVKVTTNREVSSTVAASSCE